MKYIKITIMILFIIFVNTFVFSSFNIFVNNNNIVWAQNIQSNTQNQQSVPSDYIGDILKLIENIGNMIKGGIQGMAEALLSLFMLSVSVVLVILNLAASVFDTFFMSMIDINVVTAKMWVLIRNICNSLFIIILIWVGIVNVFGQGKNAKLNADIKSFIPKFITAVIGINFSFVISLMILDFTNIAVAGVQETIYSICKQVNNVSSGEKNVSSGKNMCKTLEGVAIDGTNYKPESMLTKLMYNVTGGYNKILSVKNNFTQNSTNVNLVINIIQICLFLFFISVLMKPLVMAAIMVVYRFFMLQIMIIISPAIWIALLSPYKKIRDFWDKWWSEFLCLCLIPLHITVAASVGHLMLMIGLEEIIIKTWNKIKNYTFLKDILNSIGNLLEDIPSNLLSNNVNFSEVGQRILAFIVIFLLVYIIANYIHKALMNINCAEQVKSIGSMIGDKLSSLTRTTVGYVGGATMLSGGLAGLISKGSGLAEIIQNMKTNKNVGGSIGGDSYNSNYSNSRLVDFGDMVIAGQKGENLGLQAKDLKDLKNKVINNKEVYKDRYKLDVTKLDYVNNSDLGVLSAFEESGIDYGRVSGDKNNTMSFGKYQFNSGEGASLKTFFNDHKNAKFFKEFQDKNLLKFDEKGNVVGFKAHDNLFHDTWKRLAYDNGELGEEFRKAQEYTVKNSIYKPILEKARKYGFNVEDRGVQEMILSGSIQHGGIDNILKNTLKKHDGDFSKLPTEDQIKFFYSARKEYVQGLSSLEPKEKLDLMKRYDREEDYALAIHKIDEKYRNKAKQEGLHEQNSMLGSPVYVGLSQQQLNDINNIERFKYGKLTQDEINNLKTLRDRVYKNGFNASNLRINDSPGFLVAFGESNGLYHLVNENEPNGVASYGKYQLNVKGELPNFLKFIRNNDDYKDISKKFEGIDMNSKEFVKIWNELAKNPNYSEKFGLAQEEFFRSQILYPTLKDAASHGFNVEDRGVMEALASARIHGINVYNGVVRRTKKRLKKDNKKIEDLSPLEQINAIYDSRIEGVKNFKKWTEKEKNNFIKNRLGPERKNAIKIHEHFAKINEELAKQRENENKLQSNIEEKSIGENILKNNDLSLNNLFDVFNSNIPNPLNFKDDVLSKFPSVSLSNPISQSLNEELDLYLKNGDLNNFNKSIANAIKLGQITKEQASNLINNKLNSILSNPNIDKNEFFKFLKSLEIPNDILTNSKLKKESGVIDTLKSYANKFSFVSEAHASDNNKNNIIYGMDKEQAIDFISKLPKDDPNYEFYKASFQSKFGVSYDEALNNRNKTNEKSSENIVTNTNTNENTNINANTNANTNTNTNTNANANANVNKNANTTIIVNSSNNNQDNIIKEETVEDKILNTLQELLNEVKDQSKLSEEHVKLIEEAIKIGDINKAKQIIEELNKENPSLWQNLKNKMDNIATSFVLSPYGDAFGKALEFVSNANEKYNPLMLLAAGLTGVEVSSLAKNLSAEAAGIKDKEYDIKKLSTEERVGKLVEGSVGMVGTGLTVGLTRATAASFSKEAAKELMKDTGKAAVSSISNLGSKIAAANKNIVQQISQNVGNVLPKISQSTSNILSAGKSILTKGKSGKTTSVPTKSSKNTGTSTNTKTNTNTNTSTSTNTNTGNIPSGGSTSVINGVDTVIINKADNLHLQGTNLSTKTSVFDRVMEDIKVSAIKTGMKGAAVLGGGAALGIWGYNYIGEGGRKFIAENIVDPSIHAFYTTKDYVEKGYASHKEFGMIKKDINQKMSGIADISKEEELQKFKDIVDKEIVNNSKLTKGDKLELIDKYINEKLTGITDPKQRELMAKSLKVQLAKGITDENSKASDNPFDSIKNMTQQVLLAMDKFTAYTNIGIETFNKMFERFDSTLKKFFGDGYKDKLNSVAPIIAAISGLTGNHAIGLVTSGLGLAAGNKDAAIAYGATALARSLFTPVRKVGDLTSDTLKLPIKTVESIAKAVAKTISFTVAATTLPLKLVTNPTSTIKDISNSIQEFNKNVDKMVVNLGEKISDSFNKSLSKLNDYNKLLIMNNNEKIISEINKISNENNKNQKELFKKTINTLSEGFKVLKESIDENNKSLKQNISNSKNT